MAWENLQFSNRFLGPIFKQGLDPNFRHPGLNLIKKRKHLTVYNFFEFLEKGTDGSRCALEVNRSFVPIFIHPNLRTG